MKVAIFIYIENYKFFSPLIGCEKDFNLIKEIVFSSRSHSDKYLFIDDTKGYTETLLELKRFTTSLKNKDVEEILFFFSGHGYFNDNTFYHILADTDSSDIYNTALSNTQIDDLLRQINPNLTIKIIDACNSGSPYIKNSKRSDEGMKEVIEKSAVGYNKCFFLFSSQSKQNSYLSNGISRFTKTIGEIVLVNEGDTITYGELSFRLGEKFKDDKDQNPLFVSQGNFTEVFCKTTSSLKDKISDIISLKKRNYVGKPSINNNIYELHKYGDVLIEKIETLMSLSTLDNDGYLEQQKNGIKSLIENTIPKEYKVAIVGRFKAGKSSFVNILCDNNVASVNTNPETAVISIIKHSDVPRAEIQFVTKAEWGKIKLDKDSRYLKVEELNKKRELESQIGINLSDLEEKYIIEDGHKEFIGCDDWNDKEEKSKFLREVKKYTTSREPYHYIVNRVIIYIPSQILDDEIEIIDTPGLEDSDRYRSAITEKLINEVDAILYLTNSGASFAAPEQEFLLNQMRRGNLKNVCLIVTRLDETYDNACKDAKKNDEDKPSLATHIGFERKRLQEKIEETLQSLREMFESEEQANLYLELLNGININFISSDYYNDGKTVESGIPDLLINIKNTLKNNERLLSTQNYLKGSIHYFYNTVHDFCDIRIKSLLGEIDTSVLKDEVNKILNLILSKRQKYEEQIKIVIDLFQDEVKGEDAIHISKLEELTVLASNVIDDYEKRDIWLHWKSRRHMKWGFLNDLQGNIANKIFPFFDSILEQRIFLFMTSLRRIDTYTKKLQKEIADSEISIDVAIQQKIMIENIIENQIEKTKEEIEGYIKSQKSLIIRHLDSFVSQNVSNELQESRKRVSESSGRGTVKEQEAEIQRFYSTTRDSLCTELNKYLISRFNSFNETLIDRIDLLFPNLMQSIEDTVNQGISAIEDNIKEITQKERQILAEKYIDIKIEIDNINSNLMEKE